MSSGEHDLGIAQLMDAMDYSDTIEAANVIRRLVAEREADRAAMREALEALEHHVQQTRPIARTSAAISLLKERTK